MSRIKLSSKPRMDVVTFVVKSDMFVDRLRIIFLFLFSLRMPYRKRDQISRSYSLSWMWIQNHVQEKNKKKYPLFNKHQTCQDMTCQYKAELKLQSRTLNLGHTAPGTYFSLSQSCLVMVVLFLVELSNSRPTLKGEGKRRRAQNVNIIPSIDPSSMLMILIICNKSCKTCLHQRILTK